jgi:two-component system LytT family response regulator
MQARVNTLIVDDEPLAREGIRILLGRYPDVNIIAECKSGRAALKELNTEKIDLMFLDIQMPVMNGFQMLSNIQPDKFPAIVFITAYDQFALRAFKVHAVDYVLKPIDEVRFREAVDRALQVIKDCRINEYMQRLMPLLNGVDQLSESGKHREKEHKTTKLDIIPVAVSGRTVLVRANDIDYISAADYYAEIHAGKQAYLFRESLTSLERRLDPRKFIRIHRSTIVNADKVLSIEPLFGGEYEAALDNGINLKISKSHLTEFKKRMNIR